MRKPIDYDSELKALADKTKALKERRVRQLGELLIATGSDTLDPEVLAGAMLAAQGTTDLVTREEWRSAGEAFFRQSQRTGVRARAKPGGTKANDGQTQPDAARPSTV